MKSVHGIPNNNQIIQVKVICKISEEYQIKQTRQKYQMKPRVLIQYNVMLRGYQSLLRLQLSPQFNLNTNQLKTFLPPTIHHHQFHRGHYNPEPKLNDGQ